MNILVELEQMEQLEADKAKLSHVKKTEKPKPYQEVSDFIEYFHDNVRELSFEEINILYKYADYQCKKK